MSDKEITVKTCSSRGQTLFLMVSNDSRRTGRCPKCFSLLPWPSMHARLCYCGQHRSRRL